MSSHWKKALLMPIKAVRRLESYLVLHLPIPILQVNAVSFKRRFTSCFSIILMFSLSLNGTLLFSSCRQKRTTTHFNWKYPREISLFPVPSHEQTLWNEKSNKIWTSLLFPSLLYESFNFLFSTMCLFAKQFSSQNFFYIPTNYLSVLRMVNYFSLEFLLSFCFRIRKIRKNYETLIEIVWFCLLPQGYNVKKISWNLNPKSYHQSLGPL